MYLKKKGKEKKSLFTNKRIRPLELKGPRQARHRATCLTLTSAN